MQVFWKSEIEEEDFTYPFWYEYLTLSWRRPLSYRNQSIDLRSKSILRHERVKLGSYHSGYSHRSEKFRVMKFIALMGILERQLLISLLHFRVMRHRDKWMKVKIFWYLLLCFVTLAHELRETLKITEGEKIFWFFLGLFFSW